MAIAATIFAVSGATAQQGTLVPVPEADGEAPARALPPVEQAMAYFFEDLRALVRATGLDLPTALGASPAHAADPDLFLRLLTADVERLWLGQVATGLALVVSGPPPAPGAPLPALYRALYRLRPIVEGEEQPEGATPKAQRRALGAPDPALGELPGARVSLVIEWTRDPIVRRTRLVPPRFALAWAVGEPARFEEQSLAPVDRFDPTGRAAADLRLLRLG